MNKIDEVEYDIFCKEFDINIIEKQKGELINIKELVRMIIKNIL